MNLCLLYDLPSHLSFSKMHLLNLALKRRLFSKRLTLLDPHAPEILADHFSAGLMRRHHYVQRPWVISLENQGQ